MNFFTRFRIPTILGLGIIILGLGAGVFLVSQTQNPLTQASKSSAPEEIVISNIDDQSVTISWKTADPVTGSVKYGVSSYEEQRAVDNRDKGQAQARVYHYVTINKLTPKTTYEYKIDSNGVLSEQTFNFSTAESSINKNTLPPLIGTVIYSGLPVSEGIAYLNIPNAVPQSGLITPLGNFTIPLAKVYDQSEEDILTLTPNTQAELKIVAPQGTSSVKLLLNNLQQPLSPIQLGQNFDLTTIPLPSPSPTAEQLLLQQLDLNSDRVINSADEAILKLNFGRNPQNPKANLNNDPIVNEKHLDILREHLNQRY